jgi:hypothetical protein
MPLHPLARGDSDNAPLYKLQEFFSIFDEGIVIQISEHTASNLHTSAFSICEWRTNNEWIENNDQRRFPLFVTPVGFLIWWIFQVIDFIGGADEDRTRDSLTAILLLV